MSFFAAFYELTLICGLFAYCISGDMENGTFFIRSLICKDNGVSPSHSSPSTSECSSVHIQLLFSLLSSQKQQQQRIACEHTNQTMLNSYLKDGISIIDVSHATAVDIQIFKHEEEEEEEETQTVVNMNNHHRICVVEQLLPPIYGYLNITVDNNNGKIDLSSKDPNPKTSNSKTPPKTRTETFSFSSPLLSWLTMMPTNTNHSRNHNLKIECPSTACTAIRDDMHYMVDVLYTKPAPTTTTATANTNTNTYKSNNNINNNHNRHLLQLNTTQFNDTDYETTDFFDDGTTTTEMPSLQSDLLECATDYNNFISVSNLLCFGSLVIFLAWFLFFAILCCVCMHKRLFCFRFCCLEDKHPTTSPRGAGSPRTRTSAHRNSNNVSSQNGRTFSSSNVHSQQQAPEQDIQMGSTEFRDHLSNAMQYQSQSNVSSNVSGDGGNGNGNGNANHNQDMYSDDNAHIGDQVQEYVIEDEDLNDMV